MYVSIAKDITILAFLRCLEGNMVRLMHIKVCRIIYVHIAFSSFYKKIISGKGFNEMVKFPGPKNGN